MVKNYYHDIVVIIIFINFSYIKSKMIAGDIQQKPQEWYKGELDEILKFEDILAEARRDYLMKIAKILLQAVTKYVFDGTIERCFPVKRESGKIDMYCGGSARSQSPISRAEENKSYIGKYVYDFGGRVSIENDKLKLELGRGRVLKEEIYYNGKEEMNKHRYKRQKEGLYHLRKLSKKNEMLPLAIWYLEKQLHSEGIGERKTIAMEYNMLTDEFWIRVCGDDIMVSPEDKYRNMLYAPIHYYRFGAERKCIELKGEKGENKIMLNVYRIEYKPFFLQKEHIREKLEDILSEQKLKQRHDSDENIIKEIIKMFFDRDKQ